MSPIVFAAVAAVLLLGAGCTKEQPAPSPTTSPAPQSAPVADLPPANAPLAGLVAPAPTTPPPPDTPSVPSAPPSVADAVAPTPPPSSPRELAPSNTSEGPAVQTTTPTSQVIRVTAKQWEFVPSEIRVKKGERIILEVTSTDVDHGLSIPDFNINQNLRPGATERIEFTPDKAGTFSMVCSVFCGGGHRGMRGTLTVEE